MIGLLTLFLFPSVGAQGQGVSTPGQVDAGTTQIARAHGETLRTSAIRGRVIAGDTGRPLRRAVVRAVTSETPATQNSAVTDAQGRYELKNLAAGRYTVTAHKAGFISLAYGQRRMPEIVKPLEIHDNETLEKVNFTLPRGSVIAGQVVDEFGEAVAGAIVRPLRSQFARGQREFGDAGISSTTNDIGEFRLFGLPPGKYYVSVALRLPFGEVGSSESGYAPTYFPGTADVIEAQPISVGIGETVNSVTIPLVPVRAARVSGTAVDAEGKPLVGGYVNLTGRGGAINLGLSAGQLNPDGSFTISGVPPGEYVIRADSVTMGPQGLPQFAITTVTVAGEDVSGIHLVAGHWATCSGRVVVNPAVRGLLRPSAIRVGSQRVNRDEIMTSLGSQTLRDDFTFDVNMPAGLVLIRTISLPSGWTLRSVRLNGADVTDAGIEVRPGQRVEGIEIELTNLSPHVVGSVTDAKGDATSDYTIIMFPQDRERWTWNSRYLATGRPDKEGHFDIGPVAAGEYYVVAVDYVAPGQWADPEFLESVRIHSIKVTLGESETKPLELKLIFPR